MTISKYRELNAPTGHRPPAQGWRASAYLGVIVQQFINRNAVAPPLLLFRDHVTLAATPLGL